MDSNSLLGLIKNLERIIKGITTGISSAAVKDTSIIITFANGSKQTIAFPKPKDGISIEDIKVEGNKLITILSDGSKKEVELETIPARLASDYTPKALRETHYFISGTEPTEISNRFSELSEGY